MLSLTINYWAVLVATLSAMVIGGLWYSPVMFAKKWMDLLGWDAKQIKESEVSAMPAMLGMLVSSFITAFVLAHFIQYTQATTAMAGAVTAFWIWLGFVATTFVSVPLFERKPWSLFAINTGYYLVSLVVMGIILAIWA